MFKSRSWKYKSEEGRTLDRNTGLFVAGLIFFYGLGIAGAQDGSGWGLLVSAAGLVVALWALVSQAEPGDAFFFDEEFEKEFGWSGRRAAPPAIDDSLDKTPIAECAAPPPTANKSPSEDLDGSVTRVISSRGDIKLSNRFDLSSVKFDDFDWIYNHGGQIAAHYLHKQGIFTLTQLLAYSENELHTFEAGANYQFVSVLVDEIARMSGDRNG